MINRINNEIKKGIIIIIWLEMDNKMIMKLIIY